MVFQGNIGGIGQLNEAGAARSPAYFTVRTTHR